MPTAVPPPGTVLGDVHRILHEEAAALVLGGGDLTHVHTQAVADTTWTIDHNLGKRPSVETVYTDGQILEGEVSWPTEDRVVVVFTKAVAGTAYLN